MSEAEGGGGEADLGLSSVVAGIFGAREEAGGQECAVKKMRSIYNPVDVMYIFYVTKGE